MRKDFVWERGREIRERERERERDGAVRKGLIKLIASKERHVI